MSADLIKLLAKAREQVNKSLVTKLAEAEQCRQDLADLDEHIAAQRAKDSKQAAAEPPTEVFPPVPPRTPERNGAAVLGQSAPSVDVAESWYCDRTTALWNLAVPYADRDGSVWKWGGEVCPSELGDGQVPVMVRVGGPGVEGDLGRFDTLHDHHGPLLVTGPAALFADREPADTIADPQTPQDGA